MLLSGPLLLLLESDSLAGAYVFGDTPGASHRLIHILFTMAPPHKLLSLPMGSQSSAQTHLLT